VGSAVVAQTSIKLTPTNNNNNNNKLPQQQTNKQTSRQTQLTCIKTKKRTLNNPPTKHKKTGVK
jgi:hypothetical protein